MTSESQPAKAPLRSLLSQQPSLSSLADAKRESLRLIRTAEHPSAFLAIAAMTSLLADWFESNEPVSSSWADLMANDVVPAMIQVLDTAAPEFADADRVAAMDTAAQALERALTWVQE